MPTTERLSGDRYAAKVLTTIKDIRAEHKSCTAAEVSRLMKMTHNLVVRQLVVLREAGLVDWTRLHGSLTVTPAGGKYIKAVERGETPLADAKNRPKPEPKVEVEPAPPVVPVQVEVVADQVPWDENPSVIAARREFGTDTFDPMAATDDGDFPDP